MTRKNDIGNAKLTDALQKVLEGFVEVYESDPAAFQQRVDWFKSKVDCAADMTKQCSAMLKAARVTDKAVAKKAANAAAKKVAEKAADTKLAAAMQDAYELGLETPDEEIR